MNYIHNKSCSPFSPGPNDVSPRPYVSTRPRHYVSPGPYVPPSEQDLIRWRYSNTLREKNFQMKYPTEYWYYYPSMRVVDNHLVNYFSDSTPNFTQYKNLRFIQLRPQNLQTALNPVLQYDTTTSKLSLIISGYGLTEEYLQGPKHINKNIIKIITNDNLWKKYLNTFVEYEFPVV